MVAVAQNKNIKIYTYAEVEEVQDMLKLLLK